VDQLFQRELGPVRVLSVRLHLVDGTGDLLHRQAHGVKGPLVGILTGLHINDSGLRQRREGQTGSRKGSAARGQQAASGGRRETRKAEQSLRGSQECADEKSSAQRRASDGRCQGSDNSAVPARALRGEQS
jgi:hypothetical protein